MKDITILLTGIGAPGAPGIIHCYKKNNERNIRVIGIDSNFDAGGKSLVDYFYQAPLVSDENYIPFIMNICIKEKVDIIQPILTRELIKLSHNKGFFLEKDIQISVMDEDKLKIANDKGKLLDALKSYGFPVPKYYICRTVEEVKDSIIKLGYPKERVYIKITSGNGSRGVRMLDNNISKYEMFINEKPNSTLIGYSDLISILSEKNQIPDIMVMEYLPGDEYSVDVLSDNGKVKEIVCRRGFNVVSSIQLGCTIENNKDLIDLCTKITEALKFDGVFGFDIKYNLNNQPMVLEVNPRLTAGIVACAASGVNLPYLIIKQLLNEPFMKSSIQFGTKMIRRWQEVFFDRNENLIDW